MPRVATRDSPAVRRLGLAIALLLPSALTWLYFVRLSGAATEAQQAVYAVGKTLQFTLPLGFVFFVLGRRPRFGRPPRHGLLEGLLSGLVLCAGSFLLYRLALHLEPELLVRLGEQIRAKVGQLGIAQPVRYLTVAVFYSLVHSGLEEYYWRWFVFGQLRRFLGVRSAVLFASLGFMAHHVILVGVFTDWNPATAIPFSLAVAAGGAYWCSLYERSGSLTGPWLSHLLVDAAIFTIGWRLL